MRIRLGPDEQFYAEGGRGEFMSHGTTMVLRAVLSGARTYGEVEPLAGRSRQVIHRALHELRDAGLVDFEDGRQATLRPTCRPVPFGARRSL